MTSVAAQFVLASTQSLAGPTGGDLALGNTDWEVVCEFWDDTFSGGAMWAKDDGASGNRCVGVFDDGTGKIEVDVHIASGSLVAITSVTAVALKTWNHLHVWFDSVGGTINLSLNNAKPVSASVGGVLQGGTAAFWVGGRSVSGSHAPWDGRVQNLYVYTRVLTESERFRHWNHADRLFYSDLSGTLLTGLVAALPLSETSGTRVDATGRGNAFTPVNAPGSSEGIHQLLRGTAKTSSDYITLIKRIKTGYLDGLWSVSAGMYNSLPGSAGSFYTFLNAFMLQTTAILAGQGQATGTDISRAVSVATLLVASPARVAVDNTWSSLMDSTGTEHPTFDHSCREALYFAWKYRVALGLSGGLITSIVNILTVDEDTSTSNPLIYGGHTLQMGSTNDNQNEFKWLLGTLVHAKLAGGSVDSVIAACSTAMVAGIDTPYGSVNSGDNTLTGLFKDFTWRYIDRFLYQVFEYGEQCVGGALINYPEYSAVAAFSGTQIAKMKAYQRAMYGMWTRGGYPNWDTAYSDLRVNTLAYWMWSMRALLGFVRGSALCQDSNSPLYSKWILDELINTWLHMDQFRSDTFDFAIPQSPFGITDTSTFNNDKSSFTVMFLRELCMAVEYGIADASSSDPGNVWGWNWELGDIHVSTPYYSSASVPYAPATNVGASDSVQSPGDGISRIQLPTVEILTSLGGYNQQAFSFKIVKGGVTDIDTGDIAAGKPTSQQVWLDGTLQSRVDYDTTAVPSKFATSLRCLNKRNGANYRSEVDTTWFADHISNLYSSFLTGAAGTGDVVFSFPCRKDVIMTYVPQSGGNTTVWDGTTVIDAASPAISACKYIHLKWRKYGAGIILIPKGGTLGAGAKVSATGTLTPAFPKRQPDQDASLLVYLAASAATMGSVSWQFDLRITDGSDGDATAVYTAQLSSVAPRRRSRPSRGRFMAIGPGRPSRSRN